MISVSKTEEYTINYKYEDDRKNAKILGSELNIETDLANRNSLSLNALTIQKKSSKTNVFLYELKYEHLKHTSHLYFCTIVN